MSTPLRIIFTRSLHEDQLPPSRKEANVTPIYKKGKRHILENYRPVSLTYMAGKCMERLIRYAIMTHMTDNDLLSPKQHGFIQGRSCVTQLLAVLDLILDASSGRGGKHRHIPANSPSLVRSLRNFRLASISVRGDRNLRHLSIGFFSLFFRFPAIISYSPVIIPISVVIEV